MATLAPGQTFAGYSVEGVVGRGGMGVVYRARDEALERPVALKLVAPELAADPRFRKRFLRESRLAASLEHPHVLPVYAAGEADGTLYLAMRLVEGEDLKTLLEREGTLEPALAVGLVTQIAGALDAAHAKGLVHRDVKPGNVLIASTGESYLCDFGLTKPMAGDRNVTESGQFVGTLDYVAPEQIKGLDVDGRADQYALGCVLYECLSGGPPFDGASGMAVMWAHLHEPPPSLLEKCLELPPALEAVFETVLAKEPEDRFPACAVFVESARAALAGVTGPALATHRSAGAFVGRERELGELLAGLEDALAGRGRLFLLAGEPGIGKSRLTEELAVRARARGARLLVGRCWEAGGAPAYWPWVQALRTYIRDIDPLELRQHLGSGAADLAQMLPELRELLADLAPTPALESEAARFRLFDAVATFLRNAAAARPLVLVLDDLHAADAPSLLLLQFVARELGSARVLVLGAYRDVDPLPGPLLAAMLTEVSREPVTGRLSLRGLSEEDVATYVDGTASEIASPELVVALHEQTEGNPLFVGEIVRLIAAEGVPSGSAAGIRPSIPQGVRDVIARRLTHLSDECNRVLLLASVLGREFALEALAHVGNVSVDELLETLDEAMAARVVSDVPGGPGRLRFAHVLIRDTLYEGLTTTRRVRLHRQAVRALEALYGEEPGPYLAELAYHSIAGSDFDKGLDYARRAGDRALALLAYEEAARLYETALDAIDLARASDETTRCELLLALGDAQARAGNSRVAKQAFLDAAELARRVDQPRQLARAAAGYGGRYMWARAGRDARLVPLLEEGLAGLAEEDVELRARLLARLAGALRDEPSRDRRDRVSREAVELARRTENPAALAYALDGRCAAIQGADTVAELLALATELRELGERIGDMDRVTNALDHRLTALVMTGDLREAENDLAVEASIAAELRQPAQLWTVCSARAELALVAGRFTEASELVHEAFGYGERALPDTAIPVFELQRYALADLAGDVEDVVPALRDLVACYPTRPAIRCALAHAQARCGRLAEAKETFDDLARDDCAALPFDQEWLFGMSLLAETSALLADTASAVVLYRLLVPWGAFNVADHPEAVRGAVSRYLGLLATTTERWEDAERHFEAALEMNERMDARPWLAHTQHDYAVMLLARDRPGDRARAGDLLRVSLSTCRELGMPALEQKVSTLAQTMAV